MSIYLGDKKITPAILYDARQTSLEATINENGEHTYLAPQGQLYNQVIVTVNVPEQKVEQEKTLSVTENGVYNILPDADKVISRAVVTVNVPEQKPEQEKTLTVTTNGTYNMIPDEGKVISKAIVTVNVQPALQAKSVTPSKTQQVITADSPNYGLSQVTVYAAPTETATVTPTKSTQTKTPSSGKVGFSQVTVNPIPDNYIIPSSSQNITANGTYDVTSKASVVVNVDTAKPEQTKTVTITENGTITITPDSGKVLTAVTVTTNVQGAKPTLNAPAIALSGSTITITDNLNGNFVTSYTLYNGSTVITTTTSKTINLSTYITTAGTYTLTVKAKGTNFNESASSNSLTYTLKSQITPVISFVSDTTIQIDTIDDNALTIEVYADGVKIGEVGKS